MDIESVYLITFQPSMTFDSFGASVTFISLFTLKMWQIIQNGGFIYFMINFLVLQMSVPKTSDTA